MTTHRLLEMKRSGEKIAMITAYDYTMASIVNEANIDISGKRNAVHRYRLNILDTAGTPPGIRPKDRRSNCE